MGASKNLGVHVIGFTPAGRARRLFTPSESRARDGCTVMGRKERRMAREPVARMGSPHKEAARLRNLAAEATTDLARKILEDQARAQDRLATQPRTAWAA
jgi:hypothetical protein